MKTLSFIIKTVLIVGFFILISCNNEDITKITDIKIKAIGGSQLLINQEFHFEVIGNNSDTITNVATIKINGELIENNYFSSETPNEYVAQAFYDGFESNILDISTIYPSGYIQNVLIEDYTGTWCTNCPRVSYAIELAKEQSDKVVSVGIHAYDEMEMEGYDVIANQFAFDPDLGLVPYPSVRLNRINKWVDDVNNIEGAIALTGYGSNLGLSINSDITGSTVAATIQVGFKENTTIPLKLVVYLTENGLLYDQHNVAGSEYYGGLDLLVDFEHNDVLRAVYTNYLGELIPASDTVADTIFEFSLSKTIPASVQNNDNLHLVAFVTNANTNEVINVREVKIGETQELEKLD